MNLQNLIKKPHHALKLSLGLTLVTLPAVLISYFYIDLSFAYFFAQKENYIYWKIAREITNVGLAEHYFIFSIVMIIYLKFFKPLQFLSQKGPEFLSWLYRWSWNFLFTLIGSGLLLHILKFLFGRKRPTFEPLYDPTVFNPFNHDWNYQSFPSGHSQVLFTVAVLLALLNPKYKWLWFLLALLFSLTRAITYSHFLSDVLAGALCGVIGSLLTLNFIQRFEKFKLYSTSK